MKAQQVTGKKLYQWAFEYLNEIGAMPDKDGTQEIEMAAVNAGIAGFLDFVMKRRRPDLYKTIKDCIK